MPLHDLAAALVCPMCRDGGLRELAGPALQCTKCERTYGTESGVISFLVPDQLSETNLNEIKGNTFADDFVEKVLVKETWSPLLTHQMEWVIEVVDQMMPAGADLYTLGAGSGFDLKLLLRRRSFARVFASDIAPAATALVARALETFPGELGLFASEFSRCPVPKRPGSLGLVFQALHHAPDAHAALATLLDHNFDDLVIVEPVTNPPLGLLAKLDLVQRVEYTGTRPDWLSIPRVESLAAERGYKVSARTWWEIPPYAARAWLDARPIAWKTLYRTVDAFSRATNLIKFGSMAAMHLTRA